MWRFQIDKELLPYCASGDKCRHVYNATPQWVVAELINTKNDSFNILLGSTFLSSWGFVPVAVFV